MQWTFPGHSGGPSGGIPLRATHPHIRPQLHTNTDVGATTVPLDSWQPRPHPRVLVSGKPIDETEAGRCGRTCASALAEGAVSRHVHSRKEMHNPWKVPPGRRRRRVQDVAARDLDVHACSPGATV